MKALSTATRGCAKFFCVLLASCSLALASHAASFHGLGTLPGGNYSLAIGLSGDGKVVVGSAGVPNNGRFEHRSFRWTEASGMQSLVDIQSQGFIDPYSVTDFRDQALGLSGDGSLVVGLLDTLHPYVWNESSGFKQLPTWDTNSAKVLPYGVSLDGSMIVTTRNDTELYPVCWTNMNGPSALFGDDPTYDTAVAISDDGKIVTGQAHTNGVIYTYRFTFGSGLELLQHDTNAFQGTWSEGMSRDGNAIVGIGYRGSYYQEMYRWTAEDGLVGLGLVPGDTDSRGSGVSNDGNTVVGEAGWSYKGWEGDDSIDALIWRQEWGVRHLQEVLTNVYHLDLTGWQLTSARAVSTNGTVIVGNGINPSGQTEAWIATIDPAAPPVMRHFSIHRDGNKCVLMWPTNLVGRVLEESKDGTLNNWKRVAKPPRVVGTHFAITNPISTTSAFYRLR